MNFFPIKHANGAEVGTGIMVYLNIMIQANFFAVKIVIKFITIEWGKKEWSKKANILGIDEIKRLKWNNPEIRLYE